jgi:hypothetical protein
VHRCGKIAVGGEFDLSSIGNMEPAVSSLAAIPNEVNTVRNCCSAYGYNLRTIARGSEAPPA